MLDPRMNFQLKKSRISSCYFTELKYGFGVAYAKVMPHKHKASMQIKAHS